MLAAVQEEERDAKETRMKEEERKMAEIRVKEDEARKREEMRMRQAAEEEA